METSVFIAKILAAIFLSFGFGLLFNRKYYKKEIAKLLDNSAYLVLGGFMNIILGFFVVRYHNNWTNDWTVIITVIGWISIIKGIHLLAFPRSFNIYRPLLESDKLISFLAPFVILLGLVFAYFGFF